MRRSLVALALLSFLSLAATARADVISDLDGSALPDNDPDIAPDPRPINTWDLYNEPRPGDGSGTLPNDNFLGDGEHDPITHASLSRGAARGRNAFRVITGDPALATGAPPNGGIHYESLSGLGTGNYGIFVNKNDSNGVGGGFNDFQMPIGNATQMTLSARFKIDWTNNNNNDGDGFMTIHTGGNVGIGLQIKNFSSTDDHYELQVVRYLPKIPNTNSPQFLDTIQNVDPTNLAARTSPGYFTVQMASDSVAHTVEVRLTDELHHLTYDRTFSGLSDPSTTGQLDFGAGILEDYMGGSEMKMIYDSVKVQTGANIPCIFTSSQTMTSALTVADGEICTLVQNGSPTFNTASPPAYVGSDKHVITKVLSIAPTGKLDINNNTLVVNYTGSSTPLAAVTAAIASGAHIVGGISQWDGNGIMSGTAHSDVVANPSTALTAIGVLDLGDASVNPGYDHVNNGEFNIGGPGDALAPNSILVKYTYLGDTQLAGKVQFSDFLVWKAAFSANLAGGHVGGWAHAQFDYSETQTTFADFLIWKNSFSKALAGLLPTLHGSAVSGQGAVSAVPEPGSLLLLAVGAAALLLCRRRT